MRSFATALLLASANAYNSPVIKTQLAQLQEGAEFTFKNGKLAVTYLAADILDLGKTFGLEAGELVWDKSEIEGFQSVWTALNMIDSKLHQTSSAVTDLGDQANNSIINIGIELDT